MIVDVTTALSSMSMALGIVKTLREIDKEVDVATYKLHLADLASALADAKVALVETQEALSDKDKEIERLRNSFAIRDTLVPNHSDFKCFVDEEGNPKGYAICPACELDGVIIQLKRDARSGAHGAMCPRCKTLYDGREAHA